MIQRAHRHAAGSTRSRAAVIRACAALTLFISGCASTPRTPASPSPNEGPPEKVTFLPALGIDLATMTKLPSGLYYQDSQVGTGDAASARKEVTVEYVGALPDGTKFDSSSDHGAPITFRLGSSTVIRGWSEGIEGMRVGGDRVMVIPPELGYGRLGARGIPPNTTLVFEVRLLKVR
jgi:hypothetical protein